MYVPTHRGIPLPSVAGSGGKSCALNPKSGNHSNAITYYRCSILSDSWEVKVCLGIITAGNEQLFIPDCQLRNGSRFDIGDLGVRCGIGSRYTDSASPQGKARTFTKKPINLPLIHPHLGPNRHRKILSPLRLIGLGFFLSEGYLPPANVNTSALK